MADTSPVDYTTDVGKVRSVIGDTDSAAYQLHDSDIQVALDNNGGDIRLAAADLLVRLSITASAGGSIKLLDLQISDIEGARSLLALAKELRAAAVDGDEYFEVFGVEEVDSPFAWDRYVTRRFRELATPLPGDL